MDIISFKRAESFFKDFLASLRESAARKGDLYFSGFQKSFVCLPYLFGGEVFGSLTLALYCNARRLVSVDYLARLFEGIGTLVVDIGVDIVNKLLFFQLELLLWEYTVSVTGSKIQPHSSSSTRAETSSPSRANLLPIEVAAMVITWLCAKRVIPLLTLAP